MLSLCVNDAQTQRRAKQRLPARDKNVLLPLGGAKREVKGSLITYFDSFGNSSHENLLALSLFFKQQPKKIY
jgi:hypothetical protein